MARLDLILLRHGQAEDAFLGELDHARRLTPTGREDALLTAQGLIDRSLIPGFILCSDAQRTRETSEQVIRALGEHGPTITFEPALYHASRQEATELLKGHLGAASRVLVIGHNPTLSRMASHLSGEPVQLDTAEVAHLTFDLDGPTGISGQLWREALESTGVWTLRTLWRR
jgi:phosphohistidine phosphatase